MNIALAEKTASKIGGIAIECNVADEASAKNAIAVAKEKNGVVRILVNCAGIGTSSRIVGKQGPMPLSDFEKVIKVNLVGSFNMMRLAAAEMITAEPLADGERGVIISTASIAAYEGQIGQAAYAASKGGIVSLTIPAAREFAQFGIRVNAIAFSQSTLGHKRHLTPYCGLSSCALFMRSGLFVRDARFSQSRA